MPSSLSTRPSAPRRVVSDLLARAQRMPLVAAQRRMHLGAVAAARAAANGTGGGRIGWAALFVRGFALLAVDRPVLRRCQLSFPTARYYDHFESVASVVVDREWHGERAPFYCTMRHPELRSLAEIQERLTRAKSGPLDATGSYRLMLRIARYPAPLRRVLWWAATELSGLLHARRIGTFAVSSIASTGSELTWILSPATSTLSYGPIDTEGRMDVRLFFDHRVFDGALAGEILEALEEILNNSVAAELKA